MPHHKPFVPSIASVVLLLLAVAFCVVQSTSYAADRPHNVTWQFHANIAKWTGDVNNNRPARTPKQAASKQRLVERASKGLSVGLEGNRFRYTSFSNWQINNRDDSRAIGQISYVMMRTDPWPWKFKNTGIFFGYPVCREDPTMYWVQSERFFPVWWVTTPFVAWVAVSSLRSWWKWRTAARRGFPVDPPAATPPVAEPTAQ